MKWLPYPMLRIAGFFSGGILLGVYLPDFISIKIALALIIFTSILFFVLKFFYKQNRSGVYFGLLGLFVIFLLGYARLYFFTSSRNENHLSKINQPIEAYEAIVRSVPEEKLKSLKIEIEVAQVKTGKWKPATGNLLLYISKKNNPSIEWHYGDKILIKGSPQELNPPANPGEFDFKRFLSFKNISHQQFVQIEDVTFVAPASVRGFIYYSHQARAWSTGKLNEFIHGDDERAIASALVLGVTDGIDNDLLSAYAASGAMHVLAVSGMHIGIIYAIILFLFKPIDKSRLTKWMVAIISFVLLWGFAFITGNSPSVLRAVTMFSFIALARPLGWKTNIYNTLAASAFVLLIYDPCLIMSVGFQLSYLAVLGIVYLQRPIYSLWEISNAAGDWIWKITCVSVAAQISTFSLGLLYFHQFPTYFLVSNLLVIPLSTFVLVIGIFLLVISFISPLASFTGMILEWLIKALNQTVFITESLPLSLINGIHINIFQCWLLMGILLSFILFLQFRSIRWFYFSFITTVAFAIIQWNHFFTKVDQKQMISYSIRNHSAIEFLDHGQSYFSGDSLLQNDIEQIRFHILPNRLIHGISNTRSSIPFAKAKNGITYLEWNNKLIVHVSDKVKLPQNLFCDYLMVSNNSLNREDLKIIRAKRVIFDGSNSERWSESMAELPNKDQVSAFSVLKNGAFILE